MAKEPSPHDSGMRIRQNGVKQVSRSAERLKSALKELALGRVLGLRDRGVVRQRCVGVAPQSSEQVGADRMEQVVATKVEAINEGERSIGTLNLRDRDCAIERPRPGPAPASRAGYTAAGSAASRCPPRSVRRCGRR